VAAAPVEVELSAVEVPEAEPVEEPVEEESVLSVELPVVVAVEDLERVEVTRLLLALPEEDPVAEPEGTEPEPVAVPLAVPVAVELPTSPGYPEAPEGSEVRPAGILAAGSWEVAAAGWLVTAAAWEVTASG
jgi:hypothetical protein